ncbi:MAG: cell envelope integrity protein TolA [Inquilinus sp.]|uniref:cell envelope integrity protein TolA n=1 Tax=Inquilinus sp. TaxID=1932117 RepID=UPI003F34C7E9
MSFSTTTRRVALALSLSACVQAQPAPPSAGPLPQASGAPTAIATHVGQGRYSFPRAQPAVLSKGEQDAIAGRVGHCWNAAPSGMGTGPVSIRVDRINPDGTIPPGVVSIADNGGDPALAQTALRAVTSPACQPWPVPQGGWPNDGFTLVFDPKEFF